jgi:crossover junction endodeoxyribonuclease RuvC
LDAFCVEFFEKGSAKMVILGIDPGLAIVGWGVIEYQNMHFRMVACGSITTEAGIPTEDRLAEIYDGMKQLIERYRPDAIAVEELFFNTNITTGIRVAEARGVILLCAAQKKISVAEYTPMQVKQAVVGYGRAEKKQVIAMVTAILKLQKPPKPDDTADALAIAVCHGHCGGSRIAKYFNN